MTQKFSASVWDRQTIRVWTDSGPVFVPRDDPRVAVLANASKGTAGRVARPGAGHVARGEFRCFVAESVGSRR